MQKKFTQQVRAICVGGCGGEGGNPRASPYE